MTNERALKKLIIKAGKRLDDKNILFGKGGNFSTRLNDEQVLITASGLCKSMLKPNNITTVDMQGNIIKGQIPARDIQMHLSIYKIRPMSRAIVHTHAPLLTGLALSGYKFDSAELPEWHLDLGGIVLADYAIPTTPDVPVAVEKALGGRADAQAVILMGHGAITFSDVDVMDACFKMEVLEIMAKTILTTKMLERKK